MMALVLTKDELTDKDIRSLWNEGVDMDDWDYIVLAPIESIKERNIEDCSSVEMNDDDKCYEQTEYTFERLLNGCFDNTWYKARFHDVEYAIGVAYHS